MTASRSMGRLAALTAAFTLGCSGTITGGLGGGDDDDDDDSPGDAGDGDDGDGGGDGNVDEGPYEGELGTILFVTQVPSVGFGARIAPFQNHLSSPEAAPRGGDLMIRYPDGEIRNLTREAGFGDAGEMQLANAISVREPTVHWSGNRALFSMIVGAITEQYDQSQDFYWQIYEVSGLARGQTVDIRRIEGQPADYNNVSPIYGSDGRILFASDRPRSGERHLYPQLDDYESQPTTTGIYRLDEATGEFEMIEHSPSGVYSLSIDTVGRVIFTKWDHMQRDQQGDSQALAEQYGPRTYADESPGATFVTTIEGTEVFPEPRLADSIEFDPAIAAHRFNQFFAWEMNQDGSAEETLNHVGRQEWGGSYTNGSFTADDNLNYEAAPIYRGTEIKLRDDGGVFHLRQDPVEPAWYLATDAPEFESGSAGDIMRLEGDPAVNPEDMRIQQVTVEDTGLYRNPLRLTDGTYVAVHTPYADSERDYEFRLTVLAPSGAQVQASQRITAGFERTVTWWTPDDLATYSGPLWELEPVEVAPRDVPPLRTAELPEVERAIFDDVGVDPDALSTWLRDRDLAMVVSRNVTQRDRNDVQQPFNLAIPGGVSSIGADGTIYQISHIQFFQGDQLRGYVTRPAGRRVLARPMHEPEVVTDPDGPPGSVALAPDGSMAAFVPARRAMTWQLVAPDGVTGVVRERNWVSFRAGEIRVCKVCHGINKESQTGAPAAENPPEALRDLLELWLAAQ